MTTDEPDDSTDILSVEPDGVARDGSAIYVPAEAAEAIARRYKQRREEIGDPFGDEDDDFAVKMRAYAIPMEENVLRYIDTYLPDALNSTAENTLRTARNFAVTEEENEALANLPNPDNEPPSAPGRRG